MKDAAELLKPSGWMQLPEASPRRPTAVSADFEVPRNACDTYLCVTGLGLFRAFLNGARVGDRYLTPGCGDYDAAVRACTFPVGGLLRPGRNTLTVLLGDGWYRGRWGIDKPAWSGDRVYGDRYLLNAVLICRADGQEVTLLSTAEPAVWRAETTALLSTDLYDGEVWDYSVVPQPLGPCRRAGGILPARILPEAASVTVREVRYPTVLHTPAGETVLDFGVNMAGVVRVGGTIPRGKTLTLTHGELLQHDCFYRDNLRTAAAQAVYTGDGQPHVMEPCFSYFGFRYVKAEGLTDEELGGLDFEGLVLSSFGDPTLTLAIDHPGLDRVVDNTRRSLLSNFVSIPTDCPQRDERLGWTADARVIAPTACMFSDCRDFYGKYLFDMRAEQARYGGDVPMYVPSLRGEAALGGAGWADAAVLIPWTLWQTYGERAQLKRDWPLMREYADCLLSREGGQGLIRGAFTFGDWLSGDGRAPQSLQGATDPDFITNAFLYRVLRVVTEAAALLGEDGDGARYAAAADRVREAALHEYFSPSGRLTVPTQTAHVLSLAFGLYRGRAPVVRGLSERLARDLFVMKTGFLGTPHLVPVLFENGLDRDAWRILCRRDAPGWLYPVSLGATSMWERWTSVAPDGSITGTSMNSLNHCAYGCVCEALVGYVGGLRPTSPGYAHAVIDPRPSWQMKRLDMTAQTAAGRYAIRWETDREGRFTLEGTVPTGASADVVMPCGQHHAGVTGDFCFTTRPLVRLVRPYDLDTPLADLAADPDASACLRRLIPRAWSIVTGDNPDFLTETLRFLPTLAMFGVPEDVLPALGRALSEIRPDGARGWRHLTGKGGAT